jgi:putative chitinase
MDFRSALNKLWPNASSTTKLAISQIAEDAFAEYGIDSPLVIAHFMAQVSHECGGGRVRRESMNYSAERIMEIFGVGKHSAKVTEAEARTLAHDERRLAERVYGLGNPKKAKELGNTQVGDGFRYRGNGMLQLTGRASHVRIGKIIGLNIEGDPDLMANPQVSFQAACAEFRELGCLPYAKKDNLVMVTRRVNGGTNGLAERTVWLRRWKDCLDGVQVPAWKPRAAAVDEAPTMLGSKITQGSLVTGGLGIAGSVSQVAQFASTTTDTVSTASDNVQLVVQTVRPFLGLDPHTWAMIGIAFGVASVLGVGYVLVQRYLKLRDQGV